MTKSIKPILAAFLLMWSTAAYCQQLSQTAQKMQSLGWQNIETEIPDMPIDLKYTTADNFVGTVLYGDLKEAFLHPDAMRCLKKAQILLKAERPEYSLIVYDAGRPMSVQKKMWDKVKGTNKQKYVSNPARGGGLHNYGLAVDITIIDRNGIPLPMGTEFDHLGYEAGITNEQALVKRGKISKKELQNRLLLRNVMKKAGFRPLPSEWWHFNFCSRNHAKQHYKVMP